MFSKLDTPYSTADSEIYLQNVRLIKDSKKYCSQNQCCALLVEQNIFDVKLFKVFLCSYLHGELCLLRMFHDLPSVCDYILSFKDEYALFLPLEIKKKKNNKKNKKK